MFLPENSIFPPDTCHFWTDKYKEWEVWYSGNPERLVNYYSHKIEDLFFRTEDIFWGRAGSENLETWETALHCPLAGDIAQTSSNLLFSEIPVIRYDENTEAGKRLKLFIIENNFYSKLQEGAELTAALSGCFLKLDVNRNISQVPILSIITPLKAFTRFCYDRLVEVLFYREVRTEQDGEVIYRLFENRKNQNNSLIIEYKLYKGSKDRLGKEIELNMLEETQDLENISISNMVGLGVVYVPNMKPNKLAPSSSLGINDYSDCITLMDSLDLSWTSLIRDIELGLGQILIDEELISRDQNFYTSDGKSYLNNFSKFQKSFLKLNFDKKSMSGDNVKPIEIMQFDMRVSEHLQAIEGITIETISRCGYSPNTFGYNISGTGKDSGTALKIKERKSFFTRGRKENYWVNAIFKLLMQVQYLDNAIGLKLYNVEENLSINLEDSILVDTNEQSNTIKNLDQAKAISTYLKVKMQYPTWTESEIESEVLRINDENGLDLSNGLENNEV